MRRGGIVRALFQLGGIAAVVRIAGAIKEIAVAREIGVSPELDAFVLAFAAFTFLNSAVLQSFHGAQLPLHARERTSEGRESARVITRDVAWRWMGVVACLAAALIVIAPALIRVLGGDFDATTQRSAVATLRLLLVGLVLRTPAVIVGTIRNSESRFRLVSIAPIAVPLCTVAAVALGGGRATAVTLGVATLVGLAFESLVLVVSEWDFIRSRADVSHRVAEARRHFWRQYHPLVVAACIMGGTALTDQAMAASLGAGSVSELAIGMRIPSALIGMVVAAIGTTVLPKFADLAADAQWSKLDVLYRRYLIAALAGITPLTILLVAFSRPLVEILYEGGAFTSDDTDTVAAVQQLFSVQLPFYVAGILCARMVVALARNNLLIVVSAMNLLVNIVGNLVLMRWLGVKGIALSTTLVYGASTAVLFVLIMSDLRRRQSA